MKYQSIDEIETFSFEDCRICKFQVKENQIYMELEALIVKPDNSQNTNYIESYAGITVAKFIGGKILSGVKDGYKYYDANDVLLNEVPDKPLTEKQLVEFPETCKGAFLFSMAKAKQENNLYYYDMGIEFEDEEDNTAADSYQLQICFEKAVFTWENYLNRVQR